MKTVVYQIQLQVSAENGGKRRIAGKQSHEIGPCFQQDMQPRVKSTNRAKCTNSNCLLLLRVHCYGTVYRLMKFI